MRALINGAHILNQYRLPQSGITRRMDKMKNSYEVAEIAELGNARQLILGMKYLDPFMADAVFGWWFGTLWDDVDESDE